MPFVMPLLVKRCWNKLTLADNYIFDEMTQDDTELIS